MRKWEPKSHPELSTNKPTNVDSPEKALTQRASTVLTGHICTSQWRRRVWSCRLSVASCKQVAKESPCKCKASRNKTKTDVQSG